MSSSTSHGRTRLHLGLSVTFLERYAYQLGECNRALLYCRLVKSSFCAQDMFRKNLRRTVIRYVNLSTILVYRLVSLRVQQRFPGCHHLLVHIFELKNMLFTTLAMFKLKSKQVRLLCSDMGFNH